MGKPTVCRFGRREQSASQVNILELIVADILFNALQSGAAVLVAAGNHVLLHAALRPAKNNSMNKTIHIKQSFQLNLLRILL